MFRCLLFSHNNDVHNCGKCVMQALRVGRYGRQMVKIENRSLALQEERNRRAAIGSGEGVRSNDYQGGNSSPLGNGGILRLPRRSSIGGEAVAVKRNRPDDDEWREDGSGPAKKPRAKLKITLGGPRG
jgi:hypothetical protein